MSTLVEGDHRKACCEDPQNLERVEVNPSLSVSTCRECGCRHWEAVADPAVIGLKFS